MPQPNINPITPELTRTQLERIAEARLQEFQILRSNDHHIMAIYVSGYALEAILKSAVCTNLDTDKLAQVFKTHDLEVLLYFTGLEREMMTEAPDAYQSFKDIVGIWDPSLRYIDPTDRTYTSETSERFDTWLNHSEKGIIPWITGKISDA